MQYGHASWIPVVIFGGMFLVRYLTSQRRRGPQRGPGGPSHFTGTDARGPAGRPPPSDPGGGGPATGVPAGWMRDPFIRHEHRYWSGTEWTEHIMDDGVPGTDPPPPPSSPPSPGTD